jgi:hypothetical protein
MFQHRLRMRVGDQERDVEARYGFAAEDEEGLCALHHEAGELVGQDGLDLVGLLDLDAHPDRVHGGLDQHPLVLIARDSERGEHDLFGCPAEAFTKSLSYVCIICRLSA